MPPAPTYAHLRPPAPTYANTTSSQVREEEAERLEREAVAARERANASAEQAAADELKALEAERAASAARRPGSAPGTFFPSPARGAWALQPYTSRGLPYQ